MMTNSSASKVKCSYGVPKCKSNRQDFFPLRGKTECTVFSKRSYLPDIWLRNRGWGPLKVLNESKLILNDQGGRSNSTRINMESFRAFRGHLFIKWIWIEISSLETQYILMALLQFFDCVKFIPQTVKHFWPPSKVRFQLINWHTFAWLRILI